MTSLTASQFFYLAGLLRFSKTLEAAAAFLLTVTPF